MADQSQGGSIHMAVTAAMAAGSSFGHSDLYCSYLCHRVREGWKRACFAVGLLSGSMSSSRSSRSMAVGFAPTKNDRHFFTCTHGSMHSVFFLHFSTHASKW